MRQATKERQQRVMSELLDRKHVTVKDLADSMAVSEATVRRDLRSLADSQQVSLVHGGATLSRQDFSFQAKHDRNATAKRIIGCLAAALVTDGQQIFLDSGTTTFEMVQFLNRRRGLSVVLNSARLALEFRARLARVSQRIKIERRQQNMARIEAGIDLLRVFKAAHKQPRARQQQQR